VLESEALYFWVAAQRFRLVTPQTPIAEIEEVLDDLTCLANNTESDLIYQRCVEILNQGVQRCGFLA
jgi:hypothetical protein